jgi:CheY-like chemotaxis protein
LLQDRDNGSIIRNTVKRRAFSYVKSLRMRNTVLPNKGARIMVVDDEYDIVHIVRRHLERWGYSVDTYTDPAFALQIFKDNPDRYSMILTDIRMPEMSGVTLATLMRKVKPDVKIVIMTAYELEPDDLVMNLPTITHEDILKKPFSLVQICDAVKKQLTSA